MKKNLVSEYQSVFNQEHIESEDWNMPSDRVWTNIEQEIKKEKRKKVFFWYWLPVVLLLGGLGIFWKNATPNATQNSNLAATSFVEVDKRIEQNKDINTNYNTQITDNQNSRNNDAPIVDSQSNKVSQNDSQARIPHKSASKKVGNETKETLEYKPEYLTALLNKNISQKNNVLPNNKVKDEVIALPEKKQEIPTVTLEKQTIVDNNKNNEKREAINLEQLPLLSFAFLPSKLPESPIFAKAIITKKKQKLGTSLSLSAFQMGVANRIIGTAPEFNGETFLSSRGFGLALQQKITKRAFIEIGAQYAEFNYRLNYNLGLPFNGVGETKTTNGDFANKYNGAVPTTFGELRMEMILERKSSIAVTNGETIPLSAEGTEKLRFLRFPISIGYLLFDNHKNFAISAKATTTQTLNFASQTVFNTVISHHSAVDETLTDVLQSPKPVRWTPELGAGLLLNYNLSPKWKIGAEGFVSQTIRPIYQNNTYKNIPLFYGFGINTSYRF